MGAATTPGPDPMVRWLTAYTFAIAAITPTTSLYVPLYAYEQVGFTAAVAGVTTGVLGATGIAARVLWGRLTERASTPSTALLAIAAMSALALVMILASEHLGAWLLWLGVVAFGTSAMGANAVVMLIVIRGAASATTGHATGVVGLGLFLGFMVGPLAFGAIVDRWGSYTAGWAFLGLLAAVGFLIAALWRHRGATATKS